MTWSISASGPKENVLNRIDAATPPSSANGAEVKVFRAAQDLCRAQLASIDHDTATVMASGSNSQCSVLVHSKAKVEPVPAEPVEGGTPAPATTETAPATDEDRTPERRSSTKRDR